MATRALYVFKDSTQEFTVYKHWDGYPKGAYGYIKDAMPYAWALPRFEASDFGAAFIAGNKGEGGGDVYLLNGDSTNADAMGIEYIYTVTVDGEQLKIETQHLGDDEVLPIIYIDHNGAYSMEEVKHENA